MAVVIFGRPRRLASPALFGAVALPLRSALGREGSFIVLGIGRGLERRVGLSARPLAGGVFGGLVGLVGAFGLGVLGVKAAEELIHYSCIK